MEKRKFSLLDNLIDQADTVLRTLGNGIIQADREKPGSDIACDLADTDDIKHSAGLMRINHTGEVCAQALYQGQALTARLEDTRESMDKAAREEIDHLAWCEDRLKELDSHTSYLNPFWYIMSFAMGAAAGIAGDDWSLGFVAETEDQVCRHLEDHLERLPIEDERSRAIILQMHIDEKNHADAARSGGGRDLPETFKKLMGISAKVMTKTTYHV